MRQGVAQLAGKDFLEQPPPTRSTVAAVYPGADSKAIDEAFAAISAVYSQRQGLVFACEVGLIPHFIRTQRVRLRGRTLLTF